MRSCNRANGNNVANVNTSGNCGNNNANNGYFAAPDSAETRTWSIHIVSEIREVGTGSLHPEGESPEQCRGRRASALRGDGASAVPNIDPEDVIGFDALWDSMMRCRCGVMWKSSVQSFVLNGPENIASLCDELHDGTYRPRKTTMFTVTSPKRREIMAIPFRDRVVQRSYNDNTIYPCMSRGWIYDNAACQQGKGIDFARLRMKCHLERHARRHGTGGGILIVDVRGYYAHLRMDVMERRLRRACPEWVADFAIGTMRNQYGDGPGVNPGSQLAQIAGVDYLDPIDHAIKERMGIRGYVRYMDDLVLVHESMGHLCDCLSDIAERLGAIGLEPHPHKTRIIRAGERFAFLGFDWRLADDGHAVMTLRKESVKRMRRSKRRLHALESQGLRPEGTTRTSYEGWRAHAAKGDNPRLLENSDEWFKRLERL